MQNNLVRKKNTKDMDHALSKQQFIEGSKFTELKYKVQ